MASQECAYAARPSGTENIYKIYAESFKDGSHLNVTFREGQDIVSNALGQSRASKEISMEINEMTSDECRLFVAGASLGRLGCSYENQPYVVPIHFAYEEDYLYVFATFGQKVKWMRANPKVCVQTDEIRKQSEWISVIVYGEYEELPEPQYTSERKHASSLLAKRYQWWLNALGERQLRVGDSPIEPLFFRLHVQSMTGLRATEEKR